MDYLKEGIGLRAMAQRDPLVEYQREGYTMFQQMMGAIKEEVTGFLFNIEVQVQQVEEPDVELTYSSPSESGEAEVVPPKPEAASRAPQAAPNQNTGQQTPPSNGQGSSFFKRPNN
jgi:preprotein translocase subunit SecA